ncbi:hypothetical protein ILUMI_11175 [Ignelater luminosus]|uniref:Protein sleepless n=1 Tax=Ignelater luminosus TaxID=2038154 RepID=A0A8K0D2K7_IGNLU|nr:hypothetical protein ILUMI_11175 [Ignelater luminosus]
MKKVLLLFVFFIGLELGTCLKCYACSSKNKNETCGDPFDKKKHVPDICDLPSSVCVKEKSHSEGFPDSVHRGCFDELYCTEGIGKKAKYCSTCNIDECNSSSILVPSFTIIFIIPFIQYL